MASTPLNLGFLTVLQEGGGYLGGYLVTNVWGRPLEFRLSSAVQPNKVQQILYASTLVPYICGELIGKALVEKAGVAVQGVITTCEAALDLRLKLEVPVAWLAPVGEERAAGPLAVQLPDSRGSLVCHARFPGDVTLVQQLLTDLHSLDLAEPFARIREAIVEARQNGRLSASGIEEKRFHHGTHGTHGKKKKDKIKKRRVGRVFETHRGASRRGGSRRLDPPYFFFFPCIPCVPW